MTDEIQSEARQAMRDLAAFIDSAMNGDERPGKFGFILLTAEFGKINDGRVNYISNGNRADMISMLREYLARVEGRVVSDVATSKQ